MLAKVRNYLQLHKNGTDFANEIHRMKQFLHIFAGTSLFVVLLFMGCKDETSTLTRSSVAQLSALSFSKNDSFPGLATAVFKVEERLDTGLVYNPDSILYGTRLDSVVPQFRFATTPGAALLTVGDSVITLSGHDTVDFTQKPIYLSITSQDASHTKVYEIVATVHQVDPDLFRWEQLSNGVYPLDNSEQRVLTIGGQMVLIKNNGFQTSVYTSHDGIQWSKEQQPTGLPSSARVRSIVSDETMLYYADDSLLYTSTDALHWEKEDYTDSGFVLKTMLMTWNETVWALVEDAEGLVLANRQAGKIAPTSLRPHSAFPVSDFASVCFESASNRSRAMLLGGHAEDGASLNTRWNLEYSPTIAENGGYRLQDFSIDRPHFQSLTGASVVWYNHRLYMFGGVDEEMQYLGREVLVSNDEGVTWNAVDTSKCQLPASYSARQGQSVLVLDNAIYVIGGESQTETYSDVYRGRLNSIDW